jgi:hypothetical protein
VDNASQIDIRSPTRINAELEEFSDICGAANVVWQKEMRIRIEMTFGRRRVELETQMPNRQLSRSQCKHLSAEKKCALLIRILSVSIPDYGYDARMAVILDELRSTLDLSKEVYLREVERHLSEQIRLGYMNEQQNLGAQSTSRNAIKKRLLIGFGAITGGVAVGVTAGLAAPIVLPFFAGLLGISGAAFLTGMTATTIFAVVFGAGGAGLTGYKVERRYREVVNFDFWPINCQEQMKVFLGISGWLDEDIDLVKPWLGLVNNGADLYALDCQREQFKQLGSALTEFIADSALSFATVEILKTTAMATAIAALTWPVAILQAGSLIDNRTKIVNYSTLSVVCLHEYFKEGWSHFGRCYSKSSSWPPSCTV